MNFSSANPSSARLGRCIAAGMICFAFAAAPGTSLIAQTQSNPEGRGLLGRPSPPQPQQKQGLDYLEGTWRFTWTGRESPVTVGPRSGTTTVKKDPSGTTATVTVEGTSEAKGAY